MDELVNPAADALWGSVSTIETAHGEIHRAPRTAGVWRVIEAHAHDLAEGARGLQRRGLPVGADGHGRLADADIPGTRTAAQIRADIDRDPGHFVHAAERLRLAAVQAASAAVARDPARLGAAGAAIDAACEACHSAYWYPRHPPTPLPPPADFARRILHP